MNNISKVNISLFLSIHRMVCKPILTSFNFLPDRFE